MTLGCPIIVNHNYFENYLYEDPNFLKFAKLEDGFLQLSYSSYHRNHKPTKVVSGLILFATGVVLLRLPVGPTERLDVLQKN